MRKSTALVLLVLVAAGWYGWRSVRYGRERDLAERFVALWTGRPFELEILGGGANAYLVRARTTLRADARPGMAEWLSRARGRAGPSNALVDRIQAFAPTYLQVVGHGQPFARSGDTVRVFVPIEVLSPDSIERETHGFLVGKSWLWLWGRGGPGAFDSAPPRIPADSVRSAYAHLVDDWRSLPHRNDTLELWFDHDGVFLGLTSGAERQILAEHAEWRATTFRQAPGALTLGQLDSVRAWGNMVWLYARPPVTGWWDPRSDVPIMNVGIRCRTRMPDTYVSDPEFAWPSDPLGPARFNCFTTGRRVGLETPAIRSLEVQYFVINRRDSVFGDYITIPVSTIRTQ